MIFCCFNIYYILIIIVAVIVSHAYVLMLTGVLVCLAEQSLHVPGLRVSYVFVVVYISDELGSVNMMKISVFRLVYLAASPCTTPATYPVVDRIEDARNVVVITGTMPHHHHRHHHN
jgi:hypothetical protein